MTRPAVVIETPYGSNPEFYGIYAKKCMRDSIVEKEEAPIASHVLYADTEVLNEEFERELGIHLGYVWLERCDYVVFYTDFGWSKGMEVAYDRANNHNIPVVIRELH